MTPRQSGWRVFWLSWGALLLLAGGWVVTNPLMASPDEPAHVVRAASLVRGQLLEPDGDWGTRVEVPYFYHLVNAYPTCYMFDPTETGVCEIGAARPLVEPTESATMAGRYNPLYYAVVGLPTLLPPGDGALYLMRLVSAALCTFLVALGIRAIAQTPAPAWAVLGAVGAITPMTVFLFSTVNPAAIEIAAAFALWCQLLTLLRHPDPAQTGARMWWIALSTVLLVNARGLSLLFTAGIVGAVLLVSPWSAVRAVFATRRAWPAIAVIGVGGVGAAAWVLASNSLGTGGDAQHADLTFLAAARSTLASTGTYVINMVGQFGWMDTNLHPLTLMAFAAVGGLAVIGSIALGTRRERLVLGALAAATVGLPVLIQASQAQYLGLVWQGRYMLPVAVGIPLLAGYLLVGHLAGRAAGAVEARTTRALVVTVAAAAALVQLAAAVENLHRYVNGADGGWFTLEPDAWLPPVPLAAAVLLLAMGAAAYGAVLERVGRARTDAREPDRAGSAVDA
jgi:hypothetical protein